MKKRDYVVIESNSGTAENLARLTGAARHALANVRHQRDLDPDEMAELVESTLTAKGLLEVEVRSKVRPETNVTCWFLCLAPKGKAKDILDAHIAAWE